MAEHAGFLLTRFEVGRDRKTPYERLIGEIRQKGARHDVRGGNFVEEETIRRSAWKTHMHVGGRSLLGRQGDNNSNHLGKQRRRVAHEDGQKEARERTMGTKQSG